MKKATWAAILILGFLVSCGHAPVKNPGMEKNLARISASPALPVQYTKTVNVYPVAARPDWSAIGESHISTTRLSETSRTAGIGIPLTVQAASNGKEIFFRVVWRDAEPHESANWDSAEKLAFNWNVRSAGFASQGCGAACHFWPPSYLHGRTIGMWLPQKNDIVDNWIWIAVAGHKSRIEHRVLTGVPAMVSHKVNMDGMMMRHRMRLAYYPDPWPADLRMEAHYGDGRWTVIISRPMKTGNPRGVQFDPKVNPFHTFGLSVFPGTMFHDYSGMLTLRFLNRVP